jgi:hypothetical protein
VTWCAAQAEQPQAGPVVPNAVHCNCSTGGGASRQPHPKQQGGAATKAKARRMHLQPKCTQTSSQVLPAIAAGRQMDAALQIKTAAGRTPAPE